MNDTFESRVNTTENRNLSDRTAADDTRQHLLNSITEHPADSTRSGMASFGIPALGRSELLQSAKSETLDTAMPESMFGQAAVLGRAAAGSFSTELEHSLLGTERVSVPFSEKLLGQDISIPVPTIMENAAIGAAIGFAARTLLPQAGILGKIGNIALAGAFTAPLAASGYKIFNDARYATNFNELQSAGQELGVALGSFAGGLPVGIGSYKLGDHLGGRFSAATVTPLIESRTLDTSTFEARTAKAPALDTTPAVLKAAAFDATPAAKAPVNEIAPAVEQLKVGDLRGDVPSTFNPALFNELKPSLEVYHTGGRSNGGGVDGIQLPPKVSAEQLQTFIDKISTFLASDPTIKVKAPSAGQTPEDFRTQLQTTTADAVSAHRQLYITTAFNKIQNPEIADMIHQALQQAPPEFFTSPSSSSGKYHPADEVNVGGLSLHSLRAFNMGEKVIDFYNKEAEINVVGNQNIVGDQKDLILGSLLVHDIEKGGEPWVKYDPAHGPVGASYLEDVWKNHPNQEFAKHMQELVNNHMAQWNKAPGNIADPKPPQNIHNQIVSYADYLGSQPHVFVQPFAGVDD